MLTFKVSALKKGREEDLAPMVQKLNTGTTPKANETASQARASQLLSDLHSHLTKPWSASGLFSRTTFGAPSAQELSNIQKDVHTALKHRLQNLHGIDISNPNAIQVVPHHVAESIDTDYPTLYALARSGGTPLTALRDDLASQSGVQRRSTFLREVSRLPLQEVLQRVLFHGTHPITSRGATSIGGTQFPDPQITQEVGMNRFNTFHNGFYMGTPSKVRNFYRGAVAAFGISPKARIAHALGTLPERHNSYEKTIAPLVSEKRDFTDDEEKKLIDFLKEIFTREDNSDSPPLYRKYSKEEFDKKVSHFGKIFSYGDDPKWLQNTLLGLVIHLGGRDAADSIRNIAHIAPLAMSTIGYDGVEDPRSRHSVVSMFPHGIPKLRTLAAILGDSQSGIRTTFDTTKTPVGGRYPATSSEDPATNSENPDHYFYEAVGDELRDKLSLPQEKIIIAARRPGERGPRVYRAKSLEYPDEMPLQGSRGRFTARDMFPQIPKIGNPPRLVFRRKSGTE